MKTAIIFVSGVLVLLVALILVENSNTISSNHQAIAQTTINKIGKWNNNNNGIAEKNITGTIPLDSTIRDAIQSKIQIPMENAITTAQENVGPNSSTIASFMHPLKGFLVYDIQVLSTNNTLYNVIVDPGSGEILTKYNSSSSYFGHGYGSGGDKTIMKMGKWSHSMMGKDNGGCHWNNNNDNYSRQNYYNDNSGYNSKDLTTMTLSSSGISSKIV